jgi:CRISPR-associated protein Cas1
MTVTTRTLSSLALGPTGADSGGRTSTTGWRSLDIRPEPASVDVQPRFLHVVEPGAMLRRTGSRVRVTKKDAVLLDVSALKLQGVALYGTVQISSSCIGTLLEEGVWLAFFSRNGRYRGRLQPPASRGGALRREQWARVQDPAFCLELARTLVRAKIHGQRELAAAYARNYLAETLGRGHALLHESLDRLERADNLDELRGVEGAATRVYFDLFRRWNRSDLPFERREKHPPDGPINALLSFGYALLTWELEGLLESAGLDPMLGCYHVPDSNRPSLACDWVEEFRHLVVDRLVLKLVNRKVLQAEDFQVTERQGLRLSSDGLRKFLRGYETAMIGERRSDGRVDDPGVRATLLRQLGRLLDALRDGTPYRPHLES